jgi:translation initiation factor IF-1
VLVTNSTLFGNYVDKGTNFVKIKSRQVIINCEKHSTWTAEMKLYSFQAGTVVVDLTLSEKGDKIGVEFTKGKDYKKGNVTLQLLSTANGQPIRQFNYYSGCRFDKLNDEDYTIFFPGQYKKSISYLQSLAGTYSLTEELEPPKLTYLNYKNENISKDIIYPKNYWGNIQDKRISFFSDTVKIYNSETGELVAQNYKAGIGKKDYGYWKIDEYLFFYRDGLFCVNSKNGNIWFYAGKGFTKDIWVGKGKSMLDAYAATMNYVPTITGFDPDVAYGLYSNPYIFNDRVLFAFSDSIVCIDLQNGKKIWGNPISGRSGRSYIDVISKDTAVVIQLGYDLKNGEIRETHNPNFTVVDISSGETLKFIEPEFKTKINDIKAFDGIYYFVTDTSLHKFSIKGGVENINSEKADRFGPFKKIRIANNDKMVIDGGNYTFIYSLNQNDTTKNLVSFGDSERHIRKFNMLTDYFKPTYTQFIEDKAIVINNDYVMVYSLAGDLLRIVRFPLKEIEIRNEGKNPYLYLHSVFQFAILSIDDFFEGL